MKSAVVGWSLPAVVILGLVLASGCDPGATITYANMTDKRVEVYLGNGSEPEDFEFREVSIEPHSVVKVGTIATEWRDVVVVFDEDGNLVLTREITWDELEEQDFIFIIGP
jgi:hypothetical protein